MLSGERRLFQLVRLAAASVVVVVREGHPARLCRWFVVAEDRFGIVLALTTVRVTLLLFSNLAQVLDKFRLPQQAQEVGDATLVTITIVRLIEVCVCLRAVIYGRALQFDEDLKRVAERERVLK